MDSTNNFTFGNNSSDQGVEKYYEENYNEDNVLIFQDLDEIGSPSFGDEAPIFRSAGIRLDNPLHLIDHNSFDEDFVRRENTKIQFTEKPHLKKSPFNIHVGEIFDKHYLIDNTNEISNIFGEKSSGVMGINTPNLPAEIPLFLMPTNFQVMKPLDEVVIQITEIFEETSGLSFAYEAFNYVWTAYYLLGSSQCKFQVHIYSDNLKNFIVEGNRLSGDSSCFHSFYNRIKNSLMPEELTSTQECAQFSRSQLPAIPLQPLPNDVSVGLEVVLQLAKQPFVDSQLEACRVLCDLSVDESVLQELCDRGAIVILKEILENTNNECVQAHAFVVLANFSDNVACQSAIVDAGVLPLLLRMACDGPYQSAETRRLATYVLANLCGKFAVRVVQSVGTKEVQQWMAGVQSLNDERLKLQACRARDSLVTIVQVIC